MTITWDALQHELHLRARNTDEAAQPSELVELTREELYRLRMERDAGTGRYFRVSQEGETLLGLQVRIVQAPGPTRIKSRAEVLVEDRRRGDPTQYFYLSTPS